MTLLRRAFAHLNSLLRHPANYAATYSPFRPSTDYEYRQDPSKLSHDRDERKRLTAGLIPIGSNVIGFGAARLVLTRPSGQGYTGQPFDLLMGSEDTPVFDPKGSQLGLPRSSYNYMGFSRALEYGRDLECVMHWLPSVAGRVVFSNAFSDHLTDPITRRRNGWINSLSDAEAPSPVARSGLELECMPTQRRQRQVVNYCRFLAPFAAAQPGQARGTP